MGAMQILDKTSIKLPADIANRKIRTSPSPTVTYFVEAKDRNMSTLFFIILALGLLFFRQNIVSVLMLVTFVPQLSLYLLR